MTPPRATINLETGLYANDATFTITGKREFTGTGVETTRITNTGTGPVILVAPGSDVSFDSLQVFGGKNGAQPGVGIRCVNAKLRIDSVHVLSNASDGIEAYCDLFVNRTVIKGNGGFGARLIGDMAVGYTIQRSLITRNSLGINAKGRGLIENTFVVNNSGLNLELTPNGVAPQSTRPSVNFVTVAGASINCHAGSENAQIALTNVILVGIAFANDATPDNTPVCRVGPCVTRGAIGQPNCPDVSNLAFVDEANDDFHLVTVGPPVTDTASGGIGLLDYDGDVRPKGAAADLGADEAQ